MKSLLLVLFGLLGTLAAPSLLRDTAYGQSRPCGCYCNLWIPAPCSDNACKAACGWQPPSSGGPGSSFGLPANPVLQWHGPYTNALTRLAQYSANARQYQSMALPENEFELNHRLGTLYVAAFTDYSRLYDEMMLANLQIGWFRKEIPAAEQRIRDLETFNFVEKLGNDERRQEIVKNEEATKKIWARHREMDAALDSVSQRWRLNSDMVGSYTNVFVPGSSRPVTITGLVRFHGMKETPRAPFEALAAPRAADSARPPWEDMKWERAHYIPTDGIAARLQAAENLANGLHQVALDRNRFVPEANVLKAQYIPIQSKFTSLILARDSLESARNNLDNKVAHTKLVQEISATNERSAVVQFMGHLLKDYALNKGKEQMDAHLNKMLNVAGIKIPYSKPEVIHQMAMAGRKIVLPYNRFEKEWAAFLKVQQQTLNLIDLAQGHMQTAARLGALGSTSEMEAYIEKVFGSLNKESAAYITTIAETQYANNEAVAFFYRKKK